MTNHPNRSHRPARSRNPTPEQIRDARAKAGLTQTQAARLIYSTLRTWQAWEAPFGDANARRMHPGLWELFNHKVDGDE